MTTLLDLQPVSGTQNDDLFYLVRTGSLPRDRAIDMATLTAGVTAALTAALAALEDRVAAIEAAGAPGTASVFGAGTFPFTLA